MLTRIFSEGFRAFFLGAGLFGAAAMSLWLAALIWPAEALSPLWHGHEMIFGYGGAAMGGFFLTAVPNWTGALPARARFIALAVALWALGRVGMLLGGNFAFASLLFLPVLGLRIAVQLFARPKPQNIMFLALIAGLWAADLQVLLTGDGLRAGLFATLAMIAILGGRVTPGFTRNAMQRQGRELREPPKYLTLIGNSAALGLMLAALIAAPERLQAALALLAGGGALGRLVFWGGLWTRPYPILWILHLAYGTMGVGYLLWGAAGFGFGQEIAALHVLAIGAVGGMTLGIMSRASLGHTGRPLIAPRPMVWAYRLVFVAAILRFCGAQTGVFALTFASGASFIAAFILFVATFAPILSAPRAPRQF